MTTTCPDQSSRIPTASGSCFSTTLWVGISFLIRFVEVEDARGLSSRSSWDDTFPGLINGALYGLSSAFVISLVVLHPGPQHPRFFHQPDVLATYTTPITLLIFLWRVSLRWRAWSPPEISSRQGNPGLTFFSELIQRLHSSWQHQGLRVLMQSKCEKYVKRYWFWIHAKYCVYTPKQRG